MRWTLHGFSQQVAEQLIEGDEGADEEVASEGARNRVDLVDEATRLAFEEVDACHASDRGQLGNGVGRGDDGLSRSALKTAGSSRGADAMPSPPTYLSR